MLQACRSSEVAARGGGGWDGGEGISPIGYDVAGIISTLCDLFLSSSESPPCCIPCISHIMRSL